MNVMINLYDEVLSFLIGKLHKAESVLFRCTKIRKSKSA